MIDDDDNNINIRAFLLGVLGVFTQIKYSIILCVLASMHTLVLLARVVYLPLRGVLYLSIYLYISIYI